MQTESTLVNSIIVQNMDKTVQEITKLVNSELSLDLSENAVRHRVRRLKTNIGKEMAEQGIDPDTVTKYWCRGKNFTFEVQNALNFDEFKKKLLEDLSQKAPKVKKIDRKKQHDPHMFVLDPADIHFGKYGTSKEVLEEYNVGVAKQRVIEGCLSLMNKADSFNIEKILLVLGNDILHTDNAKKTTTSGTPMDQDVMWWEAYRIAKNTCVSVIDTLKEYADVEVAYCPSNHDFVSGFMLIDSLKSWYRQDENVKFNSEMLHRKYFKYGQNLIGLTHGDGAKETDLPQLMALESGMWDATKFRYFYCHHIHSMRKMNWLSGKDYIGVTVEYLRSCSGPDRWHFSNGFVGAPKAIEGFIHSPEYGQVAKITHYF